MERLRDENPAARKRKKLTEVYNLSQFFVV
jgi:hypothetical protein